ncbi:tRNA-splicing endonuclease subunit Sen2 isoform X1 [Osmia bicornis bicornis]|uniref:tRNA-splicing endonuclease subunit Sen2 isoform X1 n=2 Tax=Osmia bicornis bicornis TaxID=1437191 RepID=UPI0010F49D67|nr:tRNA-splicing endonuclease subunit Sen2 isoform X1 [Osmia bicornis bicornis]
MNLREPKRKRRVKLREQSPFPIIIGNKDEWVTYTAHLTELGSCIIEPNEIVAIHSMGFFGKGSLSRGFPSFGKARSGAPPIIRNRQWIRREEWLRQLNEISMEPNNSKRTSLEEEYEFIHSENIDKRDDKFTNSPRKESTPDIIEIDVDPVSCNKNEETSKQTDKKIEVSHSDFSSVKDDMLNIISKNMNEQCIDNNEEYIEDEEKREPYCFEDFNFKKSTVCFVNNDANIQNELLVLPDSDSETENYLKEITPKIKHESFPVQETLHLTFEETFFLLYGLGCLNLIDFDGNLLDIDSAWHFFCKADKNFVQKYVVYHYFRSKGWVVKPGLKYGGDFLLYKQGPPFYHASYIVIVDDLDGDTLIRNQSKSMHKLTWNNLLGLERLSETAAKEILFAQVLWPSSTSETSTLFNVDILSEFSVREVLWRRWDPKHTKDTEEEDDDSS